MIRNLVFIFLAILLGSGGKVRVVQSTSQQWVGGLQESGYGTDYKLSVRVKAGSDQLTFDELWVGKMHMKVNIVTVPPGNADKSFKKGSLISLRAGVTFKPGADENASTIGANNAPNPLNIKGQGLLGYTYKGKKAYLEIAEFTKLEKIIYP